MFDWTKSGFLAYGIVMLFILTFGFVGNVLAILVLRHRDHRKKSITPFMMNLAVADLCMIVFGYPTVISVILKGTSVHEGQAECVWSGFANGTVGISSIACLTVMSMVMHYNIMQTSNRRLSTKQVTGLIVGTWVYGMVAMMPPIFGWNKFVPGAAQISCCPDWVAKSPAAISYNIFLVIVGFVAPLTVIVICYYKIYRFLRQESTSQNASIIASRRKYQIKLVRMTIMAITAFVLSWSPYCVVSLVATFKGDHVLTAGEAEIPELLAKASVVYNPFVYTAMNDRFRATLKKILFCQRCSSTVASVENYSNEGSGHTRSHNEAETSTQLAKQTEEYV